MCDTMKQINPYIAQNDVFMRLDSTYCMYDGVPCYVRVNKNFKCGELNIYSIPYRSGAEEKLISIEDDRFSFVPPELGYVNDSMGCFFLARLPERVQKQGLHESSIRVTGPGLCENIRPNTQSLINSVGFVDSCRDYYPSFNEALGGVVSNGRYGWAFSKQMAVARVDKNLIGVFKSTNLIAIVDKKGGLTLLDNAKNKIVQRMLERHGVLAA